MINFILIRTPIPQSRPRITFKNGKAWAYESAKVKKEKLTIGALAKRYMIDHNLKPITKPFWMTIKCGMPIPKCWSKIKTQDAIDGKIMPCGNRNDWDNLGKLVSDALNKICYEDDSLCCEARVCKYYDERPRIHIKIDVMGCST